MKPAVILTGLILAACVPATTTPDPAGAAGFVTAPSDASRGKAFTTDDGWTVAFDELVLQGWVNGVPIDSSRDFSLDSPTVRFNARDAVELHATALFVGSWRVWIEPGVPAPDDTEPLVDLGVDPSLSARLSEAPDAVAIVVLHAQNGSRKVRLDAALTTPPDVGDDAGAPVNVRANALVDLPLALSAERLFTLFEPFAEADADGDGVITTAELLAVIGPAGGTLLDVLSAGLNAVVGTPTGH